MNTKEKLINDSWLLLKFLEDKTEFQSKKVICDNLPCFTYNPNDKVHDRCVYLWKVKNYINENVDTFKKLIISKQNGDLKIPNKEELIEYLDFEKEKALKILHRWSVKKNALNKNGQYDLLDNEIRNVLNKYDKDNVEDKNVENKPISDKEKGE